MIKIYLDQEDFNCLIRSGILTIKSPTADIKICLRDIGFGVMQHILDAAFTDQKLNQNRERQI